MSKLIQETKYITVQDFLPRWTKFAEEHHEIMMMNQTQNQLGYNLQDTKSCLVGEGWGNSDDYTLDSDGCHFCSELSYGRTTINGIDYGTALNNLKNFYTFKEGLYNHFMKFHKEKLVVKDV